MAESQINHVNRKVLIYNIGFGFVNGALGVLINKKKPSWNEILIKGGLQGATGGYLVHLGKSKIYNHSLHGELKDYWFSKIIFSLGNSIIENASFNRWGYEKITIDYLFTRIQLDLTIGRIGLGINCFEFLSNAYYAVNHYRSYNLDLNQSLRYGVFISHPIHPTTMKGVAGKNSNDGGIQMNTRLEQGKYNYVLSHELIHYYQDNQYQVYSSWLNRKLEIQGLSLFGTKAKKPLRRVYLYTELLGPLFHDVAAYPIADWLSKPGDYYSNFFEMEARFYSTRN